jgi:hypothetical protein
VWGSGCIDPYFFDFGTSWSWVVSFTPLPFYPRGKSPRYPLDRRLAAPQSPSGRCGKDKILDPTGTRTPSPRSSTLQPFAIPTELSQPEGSIYKLKYFSPLMSLGFWLSLGQQMNGFCWAPHSTIGLYWLRDIEFCGPRPYTIPSVGRFAQNFCHSPLQWLQ